MATIDVSFADYVRGVRTSAQGAVVLAARLEWAAPTHMSSEERKALKLVSFRADVIKEVLGDRDRLGPQRMRPLLSAFSNDWAALYDALSAKARIPRRVGSRGGDAAELVASLFPDGVSFTQLEQESAWVEGQRRIERVQAEHLARRIEDLVGDGFIEAIKGSTGELGNALGTGTEKRTIPSTTALQEAIVQFGKAVGAYGRVLAYVVDEDDEASVERFVKAVEPLDIHRAGMRSDSSGSDEEEQDPTTTQSPTAPTAKTVASTPTRPLAHSATSNGTVAAPPSATSNGNVAAGAVASSSGVVAAPPTATSNGGVPAAANATSNGSTAAPVTSVGTTPAPANTTSNGVNVAA